MPKPVYPIMLRLVSKPDGCTSQDYDVQVGKTYKIVGMGGCCYEVELPDGSIGLINHIRFEKRS